MKAIISNKERDMYLNKKSDCSPCAVKRKSAPMFKLGEVVESPNGSITEINRITGEA